VIGRIIPRPLRGPALVGAALVVGWAVGLFLFAASLPRQAPDDAITTDGIVVLTGGSARLSVGFDLLRAGKARKLFISGVYRGVEVRELLALSSKSGNDLECCVELGYDADDTEGNAVETARWMADEGFHSLRVVTANYHMPRSLVEFRRALPGVTLVPHPVSPSKVRLDGWWGWPGTAELIVSEYNKYLLALARAALTSPHAPTG
jgi:uncharacterized SAM-binding protein YcdF (DUF218 family)